MWSSTTSQHSQQSQRSDKRTLAVVHETGTCAKELLSFSRVNYFVIQFKWKGKSVRASASSSGGVRWSKGRCLERFSPALCAGEVLPQQGPVVSYGQILLTPTTSCLGPLP